MSESSRSESEAIKSEISSGLATRPIICLELKSFLLCTGLLELITLFLQLGVSTVPGHITLHLIPFFA